MSRAVLLDTSVIVALLVRTERDHRAVVEAVEKAGDAPLVTCEPVIAEACYLLRDLHGAADAVLENVERGVFSIPFRLEADVPGVRSLMKKYRSVPMDLADACLVRLAELLRTGRILTLDSDFDVYRWNRTRRFERLVGPGSSR